MDVSPRWFTPTHPFSQTLVYFKIRRLGLEVFVTNPDVPIDTSHLEQALRVIVLGGNDYLFEGSDAGADRVTGMYSLIGSCRMNGIDPEAYLRYLLERIANHPVNRLAELPTWNIALHLVHLIAFAT